MTNYLKNPCYRQNAGSGIIRAGGHSIWAMLCLSWLLLLSATTARAQQPVLPASTTVCDYATEPASISLTAQNVPSGFNSLYLLVNMTSGLIVQTNPTEPVFTGVSRGLYYAVAAHHKASLGNAQVGKLISDVYATDQCLTYGTALPLKVCAPGCDYFANPTSVSFTANSVPSGVSTVYVLVDLATNLIAQTSPTASFTGVGKGEYGITSVHYTGSLTALTAGNRLYDVTTQNQNCLSVSNTLYIRVCDSPVAITGPADGSTVASLNPVISGTATAGSNVTVVGPAGSSGGPCITTADASGGWSCSSITFPSGPNTVTATDGTTSAVSNFTTAPPASLPTVAITSPANNGTATTTPTISGTATPGAVVTINGGPGSLGGPVSLTADPTTGAYSTSALSFPAGPASVTAVANNPGGSSSPAVSNFTAVTPCTTPTVAGTAVYNGTTPLCSTANSGVVTLSGQTGNVLRWETSTDNGGTWSAVANTTTSLTFNNVASGQQYRAVVSNGASCATATSMPVTLTTSPTACSTILNCDFPADLIQKQ